MLPLPRTHRRALAGIAILLVLGLVPLAGCGSDDDPTGPSSAPEGPRVVLPGGGDAGIEVEVMGTTAVDAPRRVTDVYALGPDPVELDARGEFRFPVSDTALDSVETPDDLIGAVFAAGAWHGIPESRFDPDTGEIVVPIDYVGPAELDSVVVDSTAGLARRTGRTAVVYGGSGRYGGDLFTGLRPIYVSRVGGSDVPACGSTIQPCASLDYALGLAGPGEKVVLQGPGDFSHASTLLDLPANARIEGRNGARLVDVTLRANIPGARPAVRNLQIEDSAGIQGGGNRAAFIVEAGDARFENVSSRSTRGITVAGGRLVMIGGTFRDRATFFDVSRGDRDHEFRNVTIRGGSGSAVILQRDARAVFTNCTFRGNDTAIFVPYFGHAEIQGCTFRGNEYGVVVGEYPSTLIDPVTATAEIRGSEFRGNTIAGVKLQTPEWQSVVVEGVRAGANRFDNDPPVVWNGPAPWVGRPDVVNVLAPLGPERWWPVPTTGPSARLGAAMGWDEDLGRVILFGGLDGAGNVLDDTWSFDPSTDTWQQESVLLPPSPRTEHAIASASSSQRLFLFGGRDNATPPNVYDDLYLFDSAVSDWIPLSPSTTASNGRMPGARYGASFVPLDSDHFLLYGGFGPTNGTYAEWWIYDAAANEWTDLTDPVDIPAARFRGFAAAAGTGGHAYVYGGLYADGSPSDLYGHYQYVGGTQNSWNEGTFGFAGPGPIAYASFERVSSRADRTNRLLMFGGLAGQGLQQELTDDTWMFGNVGGALTGSRVVAGFDDVRPSARGRHASVSFRRGSDIVCMIFGGSDGLGSVLNDTWIWAPGGDQ